jgi:transposase
MSLIIFENSKQLATYIRISPRIYQSGTSVNGKGKIYEMGMGQLMKNTLHGKLNSF